jgi:predicted regulator of Ras-like GTPase activity (Roadblock/LC7/MglB family)
MFGFLKNLWGNHETGLPPAPPLVARPVASTAPKTNQTFAPKSISSYANGNGKTIQLLLQPILDNLPTELRRKALHADLGGACVALPVEKILSQLSRGVVKITFGELRAAAPGVFLSQADRDQAEVILPLAGILSQLNPALLARRSVQNQVQVPEEVSSPFGENGDGLIFSIGPNKNQPAPPPAPLAPAPRPRGVTPFVPKQPPVVPNRSNLVSVTPRTPPAARPPIAPPVLPDAPVLRMAPPPAVISAPTPPPRVPTPAPVISTIAPVAAEPVSGAVLTVSLLSLAAGWPEAVRADIVRLNLMTAKVDLPVAVLEPALKRGKVPVKWGTLRSWIKSAPLLNMSAYDEVAVELPLAVIAPLFFGRQRASGGARVKVAIDESIPDLFFGFPQPESLSAGVSHAVTKPSDTNFINKPQEQVPVAPPAKPGDTNDYVWNDYSDTAVIRKDDVETVPVVIKTPDTNFYTQKETPVTRAALSGTDFIKRSPTPKEIITRAASLNDVAGAFIALPDGLMVAGQIPPDLNGDTLAAFVPQIFSKVSQATNELRMGELNNVAFTVGNVPWKIYRVNAVFFAAFGRAGQPLPTAQLAELAAELDRKNR